MHVRLLFFARLREVFGRGGEELDLPPGASNLSDLLDVLRGRGGVWAEELAPGRAYRMAVNQDVCGPESALAEGDEVALFPPVTGG